MAKHGKKYRAAAEKVDRDTFYSPQEAMELAVETSTTNFDSTIEVHLRMGVDPRKADQQVRDSVTLPHGLGKTVRVLVFAAGEDAATAREAGADYIADDDEMLKKIQDGWTDFDVAIATPQMMGKAGRLGRVRTLAARSREPALVSRGCAPPACVQAGYTPKPAAGNGSPARNESPAEGKSPVHHPCHSVGVGYDHGSRLALRETDVTMTESMEFNTPTPPPNGEWTRMSKAEISARPMLAYRGPIRLIQSQEELTHAVKQLEKETVLGFDTETRPTFRPHQSYPPAVLQLAGKKIVYLYQLKQRRFPKALRQILANPQVVKAGVALDRDIIELQQLASFEPAGFVDLGDLAKEIGIQNHGLRGLAAVLLGFRISKRCQTSNWSHHTLTQAQIRYAATDAWVGRELYFRLQKLKEAGI